MNISLYLNQLLLLAITLFPTSYLLITHFGRNFSKRLYELGETTSICTSISGILSKTNPVVSVVEIDQIKDEESAIYNRTSLELISTITSFCHFAPLQLLEESIQNFVKQQEIKPNEIKDQYRVIAEIPEYEEKKLTTKVVINKETEEVFSFIKGNVKIIIDRCTRVMVNNRKVPLTPQHKRAIKRRIEKFSKQGRKLIGFAYKALPRKVFEHYTEEFTENDLTFIGFIGLNDEIHLHLKEIIEKTRNNNIKIYITTHLKERKARHTATELKIINTSYFETLNGATLNDFDDKKLQKIIANREKDFIFCELKKTDKERIVNQLKNIGEKVSILSPKENITFASILETKKQLEDKTKNNLQIKNHSLNCKVAEAIVVISFILSESPTTISLIIIVLIDIIVNLPLELAMQENKLKHNENEHKRFPYIGIFMGIELAVIHLLNLARFGWWPGENSAITEETLGISATMITTTLIIFQIVTSFSSTKKPFNNIYLTLSTIISLLLIYLITQISYIQKLFNFAPLKGFEWQIIAFSVILLLTYIEIYKYINRHKTNASAKI